MGWSVRAALADPHPPRAYLYDVYPRTPTTTQTAPTAPPAPRRYTIPTVRFVGRGENPQRHPVMPGRGGELPAYVTLPAPTDAAETRGTAGEDVYARRGTPGGPWYEYIRTIPAGHRHMTCPDCGHTGYYFRHVESGYCTACKDWTRRDHYAVIRAGHEVTDLPQGWDGRWIELPTAGAPATLPPGARQWQAVATGEYERRGDGQRGEVYEVTYSTQDPRSRPQPCNPAAWLDR